jgi:DNA-binding PadR family transcriptional regulator
VITEALALIIIFLYYIVDRYIAYRYTFLKMRRTAKSPEDWLPLSPSVFHILLALADGEMHGYAIMREVELSTEGKVRMGPGTLYGAVKKLLIDGLIEEVEPDSEGAERRRYYRLSGLGARVLNGELSRLRGILEAAKGKKLVRPSGAAA